MLRSEREPQTHERADDAGGNQAGHDVSVAFDCRTRVLSANGKQAKVRPIGALLLNALMSGVASQEALSAAAWPNSDFAPSDEANNLRTQMRLLRREFEAIGLPNAIKTVSRSGYFLTVDVRAVGMIDPIVIPGELHAALLEALRALKSAVAVAERLLKAAAQ